MRIGMTGPRGTLARYVHEYLADHPETCNIEFLDRGQHVNVLKYCDVIIHAAAYTNVSKSNADYETCWQDNVQLTRNLVQMCKENGNHLILISTLASEHPFIDSQNKVEAFDNRFWTAYGQTKLISELIVSLDPQFHKWTIARIDTIFGKNAAGQDNKFVGKILDRIDKGLPITISKLEGLRPTYMKDVAKYLIDKIMSMELKESTYIQLTNDALYPVSLEEYFKEICKHRLIKPGYMLTGVPEIRACYNENKIRSPLRPWQDALKDYLDNE